MNIDSFLKIVRHYIYNTKYTPEFSPMAKESILTHPITNGTDAYILNSYQEIGYMPTQIQYLNNAPISELIISDNQTLWSYKDKKFEGNIILRGNLQLDVHEDFSLIAKNNITFERDASITLVGDAIFYIEPGIGDETGISSVVFEPKKGDPQNIVNRYIPDHRIFMDECKVKIFYNPRPDGTKHKYQNQEYFFQYFDKDNRQEEFMLVNNIYDLQNTRLFVSGNYALSRDIDASNSGHFNKGKGFESVSYPWSDRPFIGQFDGNGFAVKNLVVDCRDYNYRLEFFNGCGLFGNVARANIKNLIIDNCTIIGNNYVGALLGTSHLSEIDNVTISNCKLYGNRSVGAVAGESQQNIYSNIKCYNNSITANECIGSVIGETTKVTIEDGIDCFMEGLGLKGGANPNEDHYDLL